jgi:hypothetical protein
LSFFNPKSRKHSIDSKFYSKIEVFEAHSGSGWQLVQVKPAYYF